MSPYQAENQKQLEMKGVFSLFDTNASGRIEMESIKKILSTVGEQVDDMEIEDMIQEADTNNDGVITEEDFMRLLSRTVEFHHIHSCNSYNSSHPL